MEENSEWLKKLKAPVCVCVCLCFNEQSCLYRSVILAPAKR